MDQDEPILSDAELAEFVGLPGWTVEIKPAVEWMDWVRPDVSDRP